jgi:LemA protein
MEMWLIILLSMLGAIILWLIVVFNSFIRLKNQVKNAWSQIDVQLKRRCDLIPNLINTVKGYAKHEKEVLENVTKARTSIMNANGNVKEMANGENMLSDALKSLFAVSENYPQLRANENFMQLQEELTGTENKVAASRQYYNDIVMEYNTKKESFPDNVIAKIFNFSQKDLFEIQEAEKKVPKIEF